MKNKTPLLMKNWTRVLDFVSEKRGSFDGVLSKMCLCSSLFVDQFIFDSKPLLYGSHFCSKEDDAGQTYIKYTYWNVSINILRCILRNILRNILKQIWRYPWICFFKMFQVCWNKQREIIESRRRPPPVELEQRRHGHHEGKMLFRRFGWFGFDQQT